MGSQFDNQKDSLKSVNLIVHLQYDILAQYLVKMLYDHLERICDTFECRSYNDNIWIENRLIRRTV